MFELFSDASEATYVRRRLAEVAVLRVVAHQILSEEVDGVKVPINHLRVDEIPLFNLDQQLHNAENQCWKDVFHDVDAYLYCFVVTRQPLACKCIQQYLLCNLPYLVPYCLNVVLFINPTWRQPAELLIFAWKRVCPLFIFFSSSRPTCLWCLLC